MIFITCGTCATSQGLKNSKSGELHLPPEEEARLVNRGVARYVTVPIVEADEDSVATPADDDSDEQPVSAPVKAKQTKKGTKTANAVKSDDDTGPDLSVEDVVQ
jgi:hypothetical protein